MSSPSLYSNDDPIQNRIEIFQKDNYIHYAERIRPVQQIRPTSMEDIEEAEELNRKGLDLLHKSCGRENFRNLGDQFLQVIGFIELERLNELCIQSKSIPIPQEFHDRNDQTRFNTLIQKTIQRFSIPQPIFLEKELKKEGIEKRRNSGSCQRSGTWVQDFEGLKKDTSIKRNDKFDLDAYLSSEELPGKD